MRRVLVVDDEPEVAALCVALVERLGYRGEAADSGEAALARLEQGDVAVVLLDVRLPGLDGFETCARIRAQHGAFPSVLLMTAAGDRDSVRRGVEAGADDFLSKPLDTAALGLKLKALLRLRSLHDEIEASRGAAQAHARDLAVLYETSRDWLLVARPADFSRLMTQRLAALLGAPKCLVALYDRRTRSIAAQLPAHGLDDDLARRLRYPVTPERRALIDLRAGRPYISNAARSDPRLLQDVVQLLGAESMLIVPLLSEGRVLGALVACDKPGGFGEADVQLASIFAGPAATFLRNRQVYEAQSEQARRLERAALLSARLAGASEPDELLRLITEGLRHELGFARAAFHEVGAEGRLVTRREAGPPQAPEHVTDPERLRAALRSQGPLETGETHGRARLAVPVRVGERTLGLLEVERQPPPFGEEERSLLAALAGLLALGLQRAAEAGETRRLTRQMATLYELSLETTALSDLRSLFEKGTEEAGRLIGADHASTLRLEPADGVLRLFTVWAREPHAGSPQEPVFRLGEGIAGRVARDWAPALVNDVQDRADFVPKARPVARLLCVPLTYFSRAREARVTFGVLNATRGPGAPPFTQSDLGYLLRYAGQLSVAVANAVAFDAERERSEQLALVNRLQRELTGKLSRQDVLETAARRLHEALGCRSVGVVGTEREPTERLLVAIGAEGDGLEVQPQRLAEVLRTRALVVSDPAGDGRGAEALLPLLSADEVAALLVLRRERAFDRATLITLQTLADGIGIILRNAELFQALDRTNARLVELHRMQSELVNVVAHDFRAPLAGVLGYAELLEQRPDTALPERVEQAGAIRRAATHMASLVDKTLKSMRLDTGFFPFEFGVVDLVRVVSEVAARFALGQRHRIALELPEDPIACWADRDRIAEVVENLISNAVKYSPAGGIVSVRLAREREQTFLEVEDRGIGIAPEELGLLFRAFSRVRSPATSGIEGSGLGLYICERIVKAHGGVLTVRSQPGAGSVFRVELPVYGVAAQSRPRPLLVAVNDGWTRRELQRLARERGCPLTEVADGVEALEAIARLQPLAAFLDRVLPRLGAVQIAERLAEGGAANRVPLVVLAPASELGEHASRFRACVARPVERAALEAALNACLKEAPTAPVAVDVLGAASDGDGGTRG